MMQFDRISLGRQAKELGLVRDTFEKVCRLADLLPVLRKSERFNLALAQEKVEKYLKEILLPEGDTSFWMAFSKGEYKPELLFEDEEILSRITNHPMALWKCSRK